MTNVVSPFTDFSAPSPGFRQVFLSDLLMDDLRLCLICPGTSFISLGFLPRHRFVVDSSGAMAMIRDPRSHVHGIIVEVPDRSFTALEAHYASAGLTRRRSGHASGFLDILFRVDFWTSSDQRRGRAPAIEVVQLLALAREFGFPEHYLSEIAQWARSELSTSASKDCRFAMRIERTQFDDG